MPETSFDVVVVGGGPGGYIAAIRASQLGFKVAIIDKRKRLGGTCLNIGCIPSKALLDSSELYSLAQNRFKNFGIKVSEVGLDMPAMIARKNKIVDDLTRGIDALMRKNNVTVFMGTGRIIAPGTVVVEEAESRTELTATKNILISTGSVSSELPFARFDGQRIVSSTEALDFAEVPKRLVIVGAGYIGLELGSVWKRLGAEVTFVEMLPGIVPFMDKEVADALFKALQRQGMTFRMSAKVLDIQTHDDKAVVRIALADGKEESIDCDKVLVSVGRRPFTDGLGLEAVGVELDDRGRIKVDARYRTNVDGISAIGDVIPGPMLAHKAGDEGVAWAELLAGKPGHVNYDAIPSVVYTWPEAANVGITEQEAREKYGSEVKVGRFPFIGNGRAKAMGERDGFAKVVAGPRGRLLGVHIFGPRASDLIAEATIVIEFNGTAEDIGRTCHAHPTLSEALREAALAVDGDAIHA